MLGLIAEVGLMGSVVPVMMFAGLSFIVMGVFNSRRPSGFPPGPATLPFVGNIKDITKEGTPLWVLMVEMSKIYGDVFSIKLGTKWYVVLNSYEVIHEGMANPSLALADRPHYYSTDIFSEDYRDLAYTNYCPTWVLHREYALNCFKKVSSNKQLDVSANKQFTDYVEPFLQQEGPADGIALGQIMAMGTLVTWCFGPENEKLHRDLVQVVSVDCSINLVGRRMPADIFPFLKYLPLSSNSEVINVVGKFMQILTTEFLQRRDMYNEEDELTDLCGALIRAQKAVEKEEQYEFLTDVHVVQVIASSFRGSIGYLTTTYWGLALLAEYPDIQAKVAKEVAEVIGSERLPSLDDRDAMPYTQAFLSEVLRFGSVAPMGVPRSAREDTKLKDFDIPKDTVILYNIYGVHFDETNYAKPEEFNPDRFIGEDGSFSRPEKFIPFGMGVRRCLGEFQAESFLFLTFCRLLQEYRLAKIDGVEGGESLLVQDPQLQGSRWPMPFQVNVTKNE
ncbi:cytochrome P450 2W1-like [Asterias rubens]|uniref:cytochrome P450 2W1-like n=1 Tax=Asterias rubens TaxID=7604 RepID=UPI00145535C8|nr:cytochrome P450 2W1-like [Asterias rubens]XP_033643672.1 cytochrome P450 2W1-like [Asterias rubens]